MATITTSLTGQTVAVSGVTLPGGATLPAFTAEVVSTSFGISGKVEAVEVIPPNWTRRVLVWRDRFEPVA